MLISDYFSKMEGLADAIFLAGSEMPEEKLIFAIIMGLPQKYDIVVGLVNNKFQNSKILDEQDLNLSVQDGISLALSLESWIERQNSSVTMEIQGAMANYAMQGQETN